ncbi:MAG: glutathione peroxidase [Pyrinomonadaceae bacterium]|jgi:glutathione peroxidase|nr:glutathione peroxidase [Pyrinomonadaceae bacterium]
MKKLVIGVAIVIAASTMALLFVKAKSADAGASGSSGSAGKVTAKSVYDFTLKNSKGKDVKLEEFRGQVVMLVNVASKCGYTPQYEGLEKIYKQYKDRGFTILGLPANNFGAQEPGTDEEIQEFCRLNYGVTFPVFSKISVKGDDKHPLYKYLTEKESNLDFAGEIKWNFNKFLVGRDGRILARFDSGDKPEDAKVTQAIEQALK